MNTTERSEVAKQTITFPIKGFPVKIGGKRQPDLYDGLAQITQTGPDYRGERFTVLSYKAYRTRDRAPLRDDYWEVRMTRWLHEDTKAAAEIMSQLGIER